MQITKYLFNGDDSLVSEIVRLTKEGYEVDEHATCRVGAGCYIIVVKEDQEVSPEYFVEDKQEEVESEIKPDFKYAISLSPDKEALDNYASEFGIELDRRKGFTTMLKSFQGKWNTKK